MTIFYFTSTGNCLYVAKRIGGDLLSIPKMMKAKTFQFKDDAIGMVFPTYGFGMPDIVRQFLNQAAWEAEYTFAIATYGNLAGTVLRNAESAAAACGKKFDYMSTLLMVDNYLPVYKVEDQLAKLPDKKIEENLAQILANIKSRKTNRSAAALPHKPSAVNIQTRARIFSDGKSAKKYIVNERCTKCGICAKVCPTANITVTDDQVIFGENCEECLGCVHHCPQNAIHLPDEKSTARFRNEHVLLKEIIDSNCQSL